MVEKTVRMNLLFDTYGRLLTERQRQLFSLYYEEDLSLGEIAEQFSVSRQAVYDILKRSIKALEGFEERLGLVERLRGQHERVEKLESAIRRAQEWVDALPDSVATPRHNLQVELQQIADIVRAIDDDEE